MDQSEGRRAVYGFGDGDLGVGWLVCLNSWFWLLFGFSVFVFLNVYF